MFINYYLYFIIYKVWRAKGIRNANIWGLKVYEMPKYRGLKVYEMPTRPAPKGIWNANGMQALLLNSYLYATNTARAALTFGLKFFGSKTYLILLQKQKQSPQPRKRPYLKPCNFWRVKLLIAQRTACRAVSGALAGRWPCQVSDFSPNFWSFNLFSLLHRWAHKRRFKLIRGNHLWITTRIPIRHFI